MADDGSTVNSYELQPEIIFVIPSMAIAYNIVVFTLTYLSKIMNSKQLQQGIYFMNHEFTKKRLAVSLLYLESISISDVCVLVSYLAVIIAVGVTTYNYERAGGSVYLDAMVITTGTLTKMNFWIAILPTAKTSLFTYLTNVPFDRATRYHKVVVAGAMICAFIHLVYNRLQNYDIFFSDVLSDDIRPQSGFIAFVIASTMVVFASFPVRQYSYELFMMFHHLYIPVIYFIARHDDTSLPGFIPGILLHGIDAVIKVYSRITIKEASASAKEGITHISVPIDQIFDSFWSLGGYCYIHAPSVSVFQWHPFSVSKFDRDNRSICFDIKAQGDGSFTRDLYNYVSQTKTKDQKLDRFNVAVYGPYGNLTIDVYNYSHICLIAGGVGITPMLPILDDIVRTRFEQKANMLAKVSLVWAVRSMEMYEVFSERLISLASSPLDSEAFNAELSPMYKAARSDSADAPAASIDPQTISLEDTTAQLSIEIVIHVTKPNGPLPMRKYYPMGHNMSLSILFENGRPFISDKIMNEKQDAASKSGKLAALVCGPVILTDEAIGVSIKNSVDYHSFMFGY